jgi:hypothetical protein
MKRLPFILVALLAACGAALAQGASYVYTPLGFQALGVGTSTAVSLTIPALSAPRLVEICLEANQVRYRDDGTAPTTTVGELVTYTLTPCFPYSGSISAIQFIATVTPTTLDVLYYR